MSLFSGRWLGGLGTTAFVIAALAVGRVVGDQLPDPFEPLSATTEHQMQVGETAHLREMDVRVIGTRLGPALQETTGAVQSPGIWLVADLELTGRTTDSTLAVWEVVSTDGARWAQTRGLTKTCAIAPAGITQRCSIALEVAPGELPGARLHLGSALDLRYDDMAVVDLGISEEAVDAAETGDPVSSLPLELVATSEEASP